MKLSLMVLYTSTTFLFFPYVLQTSTPQPTSTPIPLLPQTQGIPGIDMPLSALGLGWFLVISFLSGALGGLLSDFVALQGNFEAPHKATKEEVKTNPLANFTFMYDLGTLGRMLAGAIIAIPFMMFFPPQSLFGLIAIGTLAGLSALSIARNFQERVASALALTKLKQSEEARAEAGRKVKEARGLIQQRSSAPMVEEFSRMQSQQITGEEAVRLAQALNAHMDDAIDKLDEAARILE